MKQIIFLLSVLYFPLLISCSSDKSNPIVLPPAAINSLSAKVNGAEVLFNVASVVKETHPDYTDLIVTMTKSTDATKKIVFNLEQLQTGVDACYYFVYTQDDINYALEVNNSFVANLTTNTEHNIKGTFTGRLYTDDQSGYVDITEGAFNITY